MNTDLMERRRQAWFNRVSKPADLLRLYGVDSIGDVDTLLNFVATDLVRRMVVSTTHAIADVRPADGVIRGMVSFIDESDEACQYINVEFAGTEDTIMQIARKLASLGKGTSVCESYNALTVVWDLN